MGLGALLQLSSECCYVSYLSLTSAIAKSVPAYGTQRARPRCGLTSWLDLRPACGYGPLVEPGHNLCAHLPQVL